MPEFDVAYAELRQAVVAAGLLQRTLGYYTWRALLSFALLFAGVLAGVILPSGSVTLALTGALLAFGSVQVALIGHDAGHQAVFRSSRANSHLGSLCWSLVLGVSFWYWFDRHNRHHANTNDLSGDPDLQWGGIVAYSSDAGTLCRNRPTKWLLRYQMLLAPLYALGLAFAFRIEGWLFVIYRLRGRQQITEIAVLAVSLIAWLLPIRAMGWVWADDFLLGQLLAGAYLACLIAPNHKGMLTWSRGACPSFLERQVLSSRNVRPNRITDFVFGGLNYQIEHHLFPNMPRAHFCHARLLVREFCLERGLPYHEMDVVPSYRLVLSELRRVGRAAAELSPQTPSASASGPTVK